MLIALLTLAAAADLRAAGDPGLRAIRGNALSAHIRFLSDDLLEGRGTGPRGHGIAARYVATQLQAIGLEPAGERGSWLQAVPLIGMTVEPSGCALELDGVPLRYGDDVLFTPRAGAARDDV